MRLVVLAFPAVFSVLAACASTDEPSEAAEERKLLAEADDDDIVCRKQKVTGSRLPVKVCQTKTEWEVQAGDDATSGYTRRGLQRNMEGG